MASAPTLLATVARVLGNLRSGMILVSAVSVGAIALGCGRYLDWREARFVREGVVVGGTIVSTGRLLPSAGPSFSVHRRKPFPVCYLYYRFTPKGDDTARTAWSLRWSGCEQTSGSITIAYVASDPSLNRPTHSAVTGAALVVPLWGVSAGLLIWGILRRRAEGSVVGGDGFETEAIVEALREEPTGQFVLTYRYEAGVRGTQFGQCELSEPAARGLIAGGAGRVRVDAMHPERSDWLGGAPGRL